MRTTPFAEIVARRCQDPERRARLDVMTRAMRDSYDLTLALRNKGLTEQQIIDKLREVEAELSDETELYRTTFRDYIDAMRRDLAEAAMREESPVYLDSSTKL